MSFSSDVKKEIIENLPQDEMCIKSFCYGVACFGKHFDNKGLILHTEYSALARFTQKTFEKIGIYGKVFAKGNENKRIYEYAIKEPEDVKTLLASFNYTGDEPSIRIKRENILSENACYSFFAAAFLCCGTVSDPEKEYNLEFVINKYNLAKDFDSLLQIMDFTTGKTTRKSNNIIYFRSSAQVQKLIHTMGAVNSEEKIINAKINKQHRNNINRVMNFESANLDKTVEATQKCVMAILYLKKIDGFNALPQKLKDAAELRLENQESSLSELAQISNPKISKSGLSHRFKKIEEIAQKMREREDNDRAE